MVSCPTWLKNLGRTLVYTYIMIWVFKHKLSIGPRTGHSQSIKIGDFVKSLDHTMYFFIDQLRSNKMFCRSYLRYRNHSNHIQCIQKSLLMHKIMAVVVKSWLWRSKLTSDIFSARWWSKNLLIPIELFSVNHGYFSTLYFLITNISQSSLGIGQGNLLGVIDKNTAGIENKTVRR